MDQGDVLDKNLRKKSKLKKALFAFRVLYHLEMSASGCGGGGGKGTKTSQTYFEACRLLYNIEVDLMTAWDMFGDLDENVDEFFNNSKCLVAAMETLDNLEINGGQETESEIIKGENENKTYDLLEERK